MLFDTLEVKNQLQEMLKDYEVIIKDIPPSEHFTKEIIVKIPEDEILFVCGFVTDGEINGDSDDVEYVYLFDRSGNGLQSKNKQTREIYRKIQDYLLNKNFEVVDSYEDYF